MPCDDRKRLPMAALRFTAALTSTRRITGLTLYARARVPTPFIMRTALLTLTTLCGRLFCKEKLTPKRGIGDSKANYLADSTKSRDKFLNGEIASTIDLSYPLYHCHQTVPLRLAMLPILVNEEGETNYMGRRYPELLRRRGQQYPES